MTDIVSNIPHQEKLGWLERWFGVDEDYNAYEANHVMGKDGWTIHRDTGKYCNHRDPA